MYLQFFSVGERGGISLLLAQCTNGPDLGV